MTIPAFVFQRPTTSYLEGEAIGYSVMPVGQGLHFEIKRLSDGKVLTLSDSSSFGTFEGEFFTPSSYYVSVSGETDSNELWKTIPVEFQVLPKDTSPHLIEGLRQQDHYKNTISHVSARSVRTLTDVWALPYNCPSDPGHRTWFPTAGYEGQTTLINEERGYYCDPLEYYANCLDLLIAKGVKFITWHDLIDGWEAEPGQSAALIQFDIDGGPKSIRAVAQLFSEREIPATAMIHCSARHWYEYDLSAGDISFYQGLEEEGWSIGYHNNTLTTLVGRKGLSEYPDDLLEEAWGLFHSDVAELKQQLNIRTFTHHGGNVMNYAMGESKIEGVQCVDNKFSPDLWKGIRSLFSDGGFEVRPMSLRENCDTIPEGVHFFRNHPMKYGNYSLEEPDAEPLGPKIENYENSLELEKQAAWMKDRFAGRKDQALSYDSIDKPLSRYFVRSERFDYNVKKYRSRRRESFLLDYPHPDGDPRVFWWKLLYSHAPKTGRLLNVGALPPDQKEEATAFLGENVECMDIDIDAEREPDIVGDFVKWDSENEDVLIVCVYLDCLTSVIQRQL